MTNKDLAETLAAATRLFTQGKLAAAEQALRPFAQDTAADANVLRLLAAIANRRGDYPKAERLLLDAISNAPDFDSARFELAGIQFQLNKLPEAMANLDRLIARRYRTVECTKAKAASLSRLRRHGESAALFESLVACNPSDLASLLMLGHELRIAGRPGDAIASYRQTVAIDPTFGAAWWALADIKTERLSDGDIAAMEKALSDSATDHSSRTRLHFALGKAFEDRSDAEASFAHYRQGNALAARAYPYSAVALDGFVAAAKTQATPDAHPEQSAEAAIPIFVVGMPRSGSTLVEQILAAHPDVEATSELPYLDGIAKSLDGEPGGAGYPANLASLAAHQSAAMRELYIRQSKHDRLLGRRFFIDKNPANWRHIGLIRTILPEARIIDVRRHPLDCGWSNFAQLFAGGHAYSYALDSIGHYYSRYVELMAHWDDAAPGTVHRVIYEELVSDPARQIAALLGYLGLPFEERCLRFHETQRAIRTPSAEQVQRPLNRDGIERWRPFDRWLGPLRESLGPVLDSYPAAPREFAP